MDPKAPQRGIYIPPAKKSRWDDPRMRWMAIGIAGIVVVSGLALAITLNLGGQGTSYLEIYVTDAPLSESFEGILLHVKRVEIGEPNHRLPIVEETFDILDYNQGPASPLLIAAGEVPFGQHSKLAVTFGEGRTIIGGKSYDLKVEEGVLDIDAGVDMAASRSGALLFDLDMEQSVCVGPQGFVFCPKVKAVYFQDLTQRDPAGNVPALQREGFTGPPLMDVQQDTRRDERQDQRRNPFQCTQLCDGGSGGNGGGATTTTPSNGPDLDNPFQDLGGYSNCGFNPSDPPQEWFATGNPAELSSPGCAAAYLSAAFEYTNAFIVQVVPEPVWEQYNAAAGQTPQELVDGAAEGPVDMVQDHVNAPTGITTATQATTATGGAWTAATGRLGQNGVTVPTIAATQSPSPAGSSSGSGGGGGGGEGSTNGARDPTSGLEETLGQQCAMSDEYNEAVFGALFPDEDVRMVGFLCSVEAFLVYVQSVEQILGLIDDPRVREIEPVMSMFTADYFRDASDVIPLPGGTLRATKRDIGWDELQGISGGPIPGQLALTGAGSLVGVLDTGLNALHPDLGYKTPVGPATGPGAVLANWQLAKIPCQVVLGTALSYSSCTATSPPALPVVGTGPDPTVAVNVPNSEKDAYGHGTLVAGLVAGRAPSVADPAYPDWSGGIAPGADIVGFGIGMSNIQVDKSASDADLERIWGGQVVPGDHGQRVIVDGWMLLKGIDLAIARVRSGDPIDIFVASWSLPVGFQHTNPILASKIAQLVREPNPSEPAATRGLGKVIVFSAGNAGSNQPNGDGVVPNGNINTINGACELPYDGILCMGAFETAPTGRRDGRIAEMSSRGMFAEPATWNVDLVVQGVALTSTSGTGTHGLFSGTSASAPIGGGCLALMVEAREKAQQPAVSGARLANMLRATALKDITPDFPFMPNIVAGMPSLSASAGYGFLNCKDAVEMAKQP